MAKTKRKKLSAKVFTIIIASLLAVLIAIAIAMPCVLIGTYDAVMRDFFGTAGRKGGTEGGNAVTDKLDKEYNKISDKEGMTQAKLDEYEKQFVRDGGAEGYVLLKNDNNALPYKQNDKISIFSHSSVDLLAGGTGSGVSYVSSNLKDAFAANGCTVNETLWNFYSTGAGSGKDYTRGGGALNYGGSEDWSINECPLSVLQSNNVLASANGTKAMFVISRTGGEGRDLARYMGKFTDIAADKTKHYLEPDSVELGIIDYLNENFTDIVIVVNTNNAFELGWVENYENISAVLWAPGGGGETANSIADVLTGKVAPSGHLPDTFAFDALSSPAMQNMGDIALTVGGKASGYYAVSYDESIYVGYKYYETRYFDKVMAQGNAGDYDYATQVQYPFGYGISYSNFTWSDFQMTQPDDKGDITVKVKVTNNTATKAKDVVQVYVNAPYTAYDKTNKIEKAAAALVGFAKTDELAPTGQTGDSQTVEIKVNLSDFIVYDDVISKTYILEAGDYLVTAAQDAHEATNNFLAYNDKTTADGMTANGNKTFVDKYTVATTDTTTYKRSAGKKDATNVFGTDGYGGVSSSYIARDKYLTRGDWTASFPVKHGVKSNVESGFSELEGYTRHWEVEQPIIDKITQVGTAEAANTPLSDADAAKKVKPYEQAGDLELIDMRGASFDDERWERLISQMKPSEVGKMIGLAGYKTDAANSINKPKAIDLDGPSGLNNMVAHKPYSITYPAEVNIAASWNTDIAYGWGENVGMDGLRDNVLCSGWYAPAMNIHRTPFAGRNFEYFSEDSFSSGLLATYAIQGAGSMGMYSYIKHFALNDQEDHRTDKGLVTFANEQTIREIYLRPFQMAIEDSGTVTTKYYEYKADTGEYVLKTAETPIATAVMSSFNRIGCTWAGGDYRLLTQILRDEWGFNGAVLTDYFNGGYMNINQFLRAGGDLALTQYGSTYSVKGDTNTYYTQQSMKHTLYMVVNSNAMNGFVHGIEAGAEPFAYYYLILIAVGVVAAGLTAWGVTAIVLRWKKEKAGELNAPESESAEADADNIEAD